ncbi:MAG: dicarboxylate/amino acid:cation symporter [Deltaproteobacteria bacterium]|nr:dicarboxylate/amino acid:cation symporter [Deltaproteobacteria bacterium]
MSIPEATLVTPPRKGFVHSLYFRVLVAIALGIVLGVLAPELAVKLKPLGDAFIRLVKMTIAPLIFCTVVVGIAGMRNMKAVGKTGGLALLYFEVASTIALVIGLAVVNLVKPGEGMNIDATNIDASGLAKYTGTGAGATKMKSTTDFLLDIIPDTFVNAFAKGELLPVLLIAILFGFALHATGERGKPVFELVDRLGHVVFGIVGIIMKLAPLGAFGAMAHTIGEFGIGTLLSLGQLMACFYGACLLFIFGVLGAVARVHGFNIFKFVRYIREEIFIVFGTSSSESVLPRMMVKLEKLGAGKPVVGLVVPTGYSFNLDGTSIYLTMAAVFIAQATNTNLDLTQQVGLLGVLLLTSKGAAGVTGSGFVVLAATLSTVGDVPVAGLAIILGIDRFMSEARALTNVIGNGVATIVVAKWCKDLDEATLHQELG